MATPQKQSDDAVLERLRSQAQRLESLKSRIAELEQDCNHLESTTRTLSHEIEQYHQIKEEWDWFFENSLDMLCVATTDGFFRRVNPAFVQALGYEEDELLATPLIDFLHPDDVESTLAELRHLEEGQDSVNFENRYRDAHGEWHWLSWRCPALTPHTRQLYAIARDITENKRNEAEMLYRAQHDALTGLLNRSALELEVDNALARVERELGGQLVLLLIDLDNFKPVNDTYGHAAGDEVLRQLAQRFKAICRRHEFIARFGGDEFGWLAEAPTTVEIESLAARVQEAVRQPVILSENSVVVDCCIGIAVYPGSAGDAETLFAEADKAMYRAKHAGKGCYWRHAG